MISAPAAVALELWQANTDDLVPVTGHVTLGGSPVAGVLLRVGDYTLPAATGSNGAFVYLADSTRLASYVVSVADDKQGDGGREGC